MGMTECTAGIPVEYSYTETSHKTNWRKQTFSRQRGDVQYCQDGPKEKGFYLKANCKIVPSSGSETSAAKGCHHLMGLKRIFVAPTQNGERGNC